MDIMFLIDAVIILFGIYMVISSLHMRKSGEISTLVLTKEEAAKCKDKSGYIQFVYWREALLGAAVIFVGLLGILNCLVVSLRAANIAVVIVFLASFLWFQRELGRAREKFLH